MENVKMHAKYIRRISCTLFIILAGGLVFHAAVKYRRYPFGIGGSYRLARSSYIAGVKEPILPDELVGGLYDTDDGLMLDGNKHERSLAQFCLDGSPLPPIATTTSPSSSSSSSSHHHQHRRRSAIASSSMRPPYDILHSSEIFSNETASLDDVAASIKAKYNDLLQATLNNRATNTQKQGDCRPRIIEYRCSGSESARCGGMGDRLRGMSATFLIALLTNSVFSLNWDYPVSLEAFFEPAFLPRKLLVEQFFPEKPNEIVIRAIDDEEDIVWLLSDITRLRHAFRSYDVLVFEINSLVPLEVLLSHPYYRSLVDFYDITNYSYSELFSIALRILLPQHAPRLAEAAAPYVDALRSPEYDARVGIQIRLGSAGWNEFARVGTSQVRCFVDELRGIAGENRYRNVLVFVSADSEDALHELERLTASSPSPSLDNNSTSFKLMTAGKVAKITHIDRTSFDSSDKAAAALRTFVDWAVLASPQMDHLIISRSSFGETASILRLAAKSTRRLAHNVTDSCLFHDYVMTSVWMEAAAPSWLILTPSPTIILAATASIQLLLVHW